MEKYTYFVIGERSKENGRNIAYAQRIHNCNNLLYAIHPRKDMELVSINACDTWKEAQEIARFWNECYQKNGTYLFQKGA